MAHGGRAIEVARRVEQQPPYRPRPVGLSSEGVEDGESLRWRGQSGVRRAGERSSIV
jgi:hypothetical protein